MKHKLVVIEWDDNTHSTQSWLDAEDVKDLATNLYWRCRNVGYIVYQDKNCVTLSSRIANDGEHFGLVERIPRKAIRKMKKL